MAKKAGRGSRIGNILKTLVVLAFIGLIFLVSAFIYYAGQIPDPSSIAARKVSESTKIYDRTGEVLLYDIHGEEKRTIIPWEQMPEYVKKATLAAEDSEFYNHSGIDFKGIARAFYRDLTTFSASQGGSTITQQLIKTSLLGQEKTIARKIKEAILAVQIETKFSKDQILWMYLNQIPYGSNVYGIESASQTFFGKQTKDLILSESALLASMIKAPSYYSPYGNHVKELLARRNYILDRMKKSGFVSEKDYQIAVKDVPKIKPFRDNIQAPHFVIMVKEYLTKKYGEDMVENGGLKVITTLDSKLQKISEESLQKYCKINAEKYKAKNAAMVAGDPKTGQILTMVGSCDYFDIANEGNFNVALAFRQPGSSFKPFAYAKAFEKGFPDSTILFDLPTEFNPNCDSSATQIKDPTGQDCYNPQNYDGLFRGPVTMRQALAQSLNIPSVETLYLAGLDNTINLAHKMGITTLNDRDRYGLSLVLGGGEVRLVDMISAYSVFANDGVFNEPSFLLKVTTGNGLVLEEYKQNEERVLDSQIARLISDVLSDNNARSPVFGYNSALYFPDRAVAAKTGTTQENRDGWVIGFTPSLVAGVWTGNNNNTSMTKQGAGISAAGPMWHEFIAKALQNTPSEQFVKPGPVSSDKPILSGEYSGPEGVHNILYYVNKDDPGGYKPDNPYDDPQFKNWEAVVQKWLVGR